MTLFFIVSEAFHQDRIQGQIYPGRTSSLGERETAPCPYDRISLTLESITAEGVHCWFTVPIGDQKVMGSVSPGDAERLPVLCADGAGR